MYTFYESNPNHNYGVHATNDNTKATPTASRNSLLLDFCGKACKLRDY